MADFLSSVIRSFLVKHGFATSTTPQQTQLSFDRSRSPSPRKKRKIASFDESLGSLGPRLNRIKLLTPSSNQSSAYTDTGNDPHTKTLVIHPVGTSRSIQSF